MDLLHKSELSHIPPDLDKIDGLCIIIGAVDFSIFNRKYSSQSILRHQSLNT